MNDNSKTKEELINELNLLRSKVIELERNQLSHQDKLKLAVIERAPFTMWACNRNFEIVLWTGACEQLYSLREHEALHKNYLTLFVDEAERQESQEDCLEVIDQDYVFKNFLAYDHSKDGNRRTMLTNCFRIWDESTNQHLQAEIAIEISDLELRKDEHRTLRELGIARLEQEKKVFKLSQREIMARIGMAYSTRILAVEDKQRELDQWKNKIKRTPGTENVNVEDLTKEQQQKINSEKEAIDIAQKSLYELLSQAVTTEDLDKIEKELARFIRG